MHRQGQRRHAKGCAVVSAIGSHVGLLQSIFLPGFIRFRAACANHHGVRPRKHRQLRLILQRISLKEVATTPGGRIAMRWNHEQTWRGAFSGWRDCWQDVFRRTMSSLAATASRLPQVYRIGPGEA